MKECSVYTNLIDFFDPPIDSVERPFVSNVIDEKNTLDSVADIIKRLQLILIWRQL